MTAVLVNAAGCASWAARAGKMYPPGTLYPGVRASTEYSPRAMYKEVTSPEHLESGGNEGDVVIVICLTPLMLPDLLVFTPLADTILLPHDLWWKILRRRRSQDTQPPPASDSVPRADGAVPGTPEE